MSEIEKPLSTELTTATFATERASVVMRVEFGLLDATEVEQLHDEHDPAGLLEVQLNGDDRFPGVQFDRQAGHVKLVVGDLLELAGSMGRTTACASFDRTAYSKSLARIGNCDT